MTLDLKYVTAETDEVKVIATFGRIQVDERAAKEIDKKIKDSNLLFIYNSTLKHDEFYLSGGRRRMFFEFVMSREERKELEEAGRTVERTFRRLSKQHKEGLNTILGRLSESRRYH